MKIKNIIFDFGGVLVDWNPRYVFQKYFDNEQEMESFLKHICTDKWNAEQDRGRSLKEGTEILQKQFPEHSAMIAKFYGEWEDMLKDAIHGSVEILKELNEKYPLYGLTNWSAETIDVAYRRFPFFSLFRGIVVSGEEKLIKPDPKIYQRLLNRYHLTAQECLFIDDNAENVAAARTQGIHAVQFTNPDELKEYLINNQIL